MKKFYIYTHSKPNGEIFYVGKGTAKRAYKTSQRNKFWWNIVNKYDYKVKIVKYFATDEEAAVAETKLIAKYRKEGVKLVNQTDGGDGGSAGRIWSDKTRKKLSERVMGEKNPMFGVKLTKKQREERSKARLGKNNFFYGKKHSEETKKKLRAAWKRRRLIGTSDETRKKMSKRMLGSGNIMFGRKHSKETKLKISKSIKRKST